MIFSLLMNGHLGRDVVYKERVARAFPTRRAASSMSSKEVNRPKLKRMEASLFAAVKPIARST